MYTVSLGTPGATIVDAKGRTQPAPPDPETLRAMADASGGQPFAVEDADALNQVHERLGSQVATQREPREVTAAFAGGALALVAGGALLSSTGSAGPLRFFSPALPFPESKPRLTGRGHGEICHAIGPRDCSVRRGSDGRRRSTA